MLNSSNVSISSDQTYTDSLFWTWLRLLINLLGILLTVLQCIFIAKRPGQLHGSINKVTNSLKLKKDVTRNPHQKHKVSRSF